MSKKKPRSKDPHSWIRDTTKEGAGPEAAEEAAADDAALDEPEEAEDEAGPRRCVIFEFDPSDGRILASHEVLEDSGVDVGQAPTNLAEGKASACIALTRGLRDKTLRDLHTNYKVVVSKSRPALVPKG
ncbi:MAG TPA: hypothetical protein VGX48_08315 [Pyrinomonadaceae bacterium]|jgi:hypothetical protein|nr:hypothetical protein [Pyrinomonadaceae bacterium]